eukprot:CAMPEP_0168350206 /NCGR_PEP_ID=MMETSP0213-20121227/20959_1 /TAXON_ID=151035 /ORGANISM="Euplotes harpa, Strain FSP1.4" /LENGTH=187 /DNA_ID=CAMNT_0008360465 /DNA_START=187 /DNA_END=750 /DNA_ORIENTATION=-
MREIDAIPNDQVEFLKETKNHGQLNSSVEPLIEADNEGRVLRSEQTVVGGFKTDPLNHVWIFWLYFFEYCVITGFFDRLAQLRKADESSDFFEKNLFTISQFLYQAGVLIARSSLYVLKSKATGVITVVLLAHFLALSRWIIFILALSLGIFGGWGYLFSYFRCMDNTKVSEKNREVLINYLAISAD